MNYLSDVKLLRLAVTDLEVFFGGFGFFWGLGGGLGECFLFGFGVGEHNHGLTLNDFRLGVLP